MAAVDVDPAKLLDAEGRRLGWPAKSRVGARSGRQIKSGKITISIEQTKSFEKVITACKDVDYCDPHILTEEDLLLRFYIARSYDVKATLQAVKAYTKWRKEKDINNIHAWCAKHVKPEWLYKTHYKGYCGFYGFCKEGYPIWWECPEAKGLETVLKTIGKEKALRCHHAMLERTREHCKLLGVDRFQYVIDLRYLPVMSIITGSLSEYLKEQIREDSEYFPECMCRMIIINAPMGFSTAYNFVKYLLDDNVKSKISVDGARSAGDTLSQVATKANVPAEFGGAAAVDWDVCRPVATSDTNIFRASMYTDRLRKLGVLKTSCDDDAGK